MFRSQFWFGLLCLGALGLLILGGFSLLFNDRGNYCEMTYMYEYPKFVHIKVQENEMYPQYSLYSYSEGRLTEKARKMRFDGIPVLYLPGNSGSRSQARSLASVALRMGLSDENGLHFDYFTISFNEELSGLYGGVLETQTKFASNAIKRILNLYKVNQYTKTVPNNVILIGHSMGGVIAKRLLVYEDSQNITMLAVTLAAPVAAPVLNFDIETDKYYTRMHREWADSQSKNEKVLLSFGAGPRDYMVPSSLVVSEYSDFGALMTAVPGVWVSPDHQSMVWCRQFMIRFNRFLFSIVDRSTKQIVDDKQFIMDKTRSFFQANNSMYLDIDAKRKTTMLTQDAFWYEDNRRIFQISRPSINKVTNLMIRLVGTHMDRFVAIETVNHSDKDWIFGCNAAYTNNYQRVCREATSLSELTRWSAAAKGYGKRKLATIHLHDVMMKEPEWTHIVVRTTPTRTKVELNIDINDFASRNITVSLPSIFSFGKTVILEETESNAIYYQLLLPGMNNLHDTFLFYVEPLNCGQNDYHVSAQMSIPWASNSDYYHFFTSKLRKPMKLRLFHTNPNMMNNTDVTDYAKLSLILDPKCTFKISIEPSRYHAIGQLVRQHCPILISYIAAVLLLTARSCLFSVMETGSCQYAHKALASHSLRPYYLLVCARLGTMVLSTVPVLSYALETAGQQNLELLYLTRTLLSVPLYFVALGIVNVLVAAILITALFCSQLAHKLFFKIIFRGGGGALAEKFAGLIQKAPALISAALVLNVTTSCGAASLAAGGLFYFFMLSKMYEDYLEDYAFKLLAKFGSKIRKYLRKGKMKETEEITESTALLSQNLVSVSDDNIFDSNNEEMHIDDKIKSIEDFSGAKEEIISQKLILVKSKIDPKICEDVKRNQHTERDNQEISDNKEISIVDNKCTENEQISIIDNKCSINNDLDKINEVNANNENSTDNKKKTESNVDEDLSGINFHFMMFLLWSVVSLINLPALLTWARNFKFSMILTPDTSFYSGLIMSVCTGFLWQISSPRQNLKHYETVTQILFLLAVIVIVMGPLASYYINYAVVTAFVMITCQQLFDTESPSQNHGPSLVDNDENASNENERTNNSENINSENAEETIYDKIKNMREKVNSTDS